MARGDSKLVDGISAEGAGRINVNTSFAC